MAELQATDVSRKQLSKDAQYTYENCSGSSQSPIDIDRSLVVKKEFPVLKFANYELVTEKNTNLTNNGKTFRIQLKVRKKEINS